MSRASAPAKKVNQLIGRLAKLAAAPALDEFSLQRVARDANALMKSDPAGAHTVLGGVAALGGDRDETRRRHRTALQIKGSFATFYNYFVSLSLLDEHEEALQVANRALEKYPDNLELLNSAIKAALESANFETARNLSHRWDALAPDRPNSRSGMSRLLADAVLAGTFKEESVREVLRVLSQTQRTENVRSSNPKFRLHHVEESFFYERMIHATPTAAAALNERFADQIADRTDLMADPGLQFVAAFTADTSNGRHS